MMSEGRSRQPNSNADEQQQQQAQNNNNNNGSLPPVNFCDIMTVFEKAVQEVRCGQVAMRKNAAAAAAAAGARSQFTMTRAECLCVTLSVSLFVAKDRVCCGVSHSFD